MLRWDGVEQLTAACSALEELGLHVVAVIRAMTYNEG